MKKLNDLYIVKVRKSEHVESLLSEQIAIVEDVQMIEYSYDEAIETYVSYCEDGVECRYTKLDESINNLIVELDKQLQIYSIKLHQAIRENNEINKIKYHNILYGIELSLYKILELNNIPTIDFRKRITDYLDVIANKEIF